MGVYSICIKGVCSNITDRCRHFPPLQHCILSDTAIGVNVDALVFIANQDLCSSFVWQNDDCMGTDGTWDLQSNAHTNTT